VAAAAEGRPDRRQRLVGQLAREVHGHLARPGDGLGARGRQQLRRADAERRARRLLDVATVRAFGFEIGIEPVEHLAGEAASTAGR
jgi:hypothetical protein